MINSRNPQDIIVHGIVDISNQSQGRNNAKLYYVHGYSSIIGYLGNLTPDGAGMRRRGHLVTYSH